MCAVLLASCASDTCSRSVTRLLPAGQATAMKPARRGHQVWPLSRLKGILAWTDILRQQEVGVNEATWCGASAEIPTALSHTTPADWKLCRACLSVCMADDSSRQLIAIHASTMHAVRMQRPVACIGSSTLHACYCVARMQTCADERHTSVMLTEVACACYGV